MRWTDERVKAAKPTAGKREQRMCVEPGLYLYVRARADGQVARQWQFRAQVDGVRKWLSLGSFPGVGLAQARAELAPHRVAQEAAKKGEGDHPVVVARVARRTKRAQPTVAELFEEWIADKRMGSRRKGGVPVRERTVQILRENFDADVREHIGGSKVAMLTRAAVQECIDRPRRRRAPGSAAQVFRLLRGLFIFASKRGYLDGRDPMRGIENPRPYRPAAQVNAARSDEELSALFRLLDGSRVWPATRLAIEFQLLTGARPSEVRLMLWSDVNYERKTWTIPAERFKTDREHQIHLSSHALLVLDQARRLSDDSAYVFAGARSSDGESPGPMEKMAVARALSRLAASPNWTLAVKLRPHDLRRTFRTMLSRLRVEPHVAELCLGHIERETMRRVYDGHDYREETAAAWDLAGNHIAKLRGHTLKVVALRRA